MIKSFKKLQKRNSQPRTRESKSEIATITPKAIVKALYDYDAQGDDELSFRQQDFLYVVDNSDPEWFVACNPLSNTSGLVPVSYFEIIQRPEVIPSVSLSTAMTKGFDSPETSRPPSSSAGTLAEPSPKSRKSLALYGFVLYDFTAERNDELEAKRGESIIIIAQSNSEWFVAKPIGRLGGPGLIPVSYVQLREVGTDKPFEDFQEAIRSAGIPQVEEWKRRAAEYKASSIPLGRFEEPYAVESQQPASVAAAPFQTQYVPQPSAAPNNGNVYIKHARVDRFAINGGRYWYLVNVEMSNGKFRNLCRYYQDFYDFQIKLLEEFPEEAGRTGKPRSLPFMPGPLTLVNHSISSQRRANLDEYVRKLVCMPAHISQSQLIIQLFAIRPGDIEGDEPSAQMPIPPGDEAAAAADQERIQQPTGSGSSSTNLQQPQYQYQRQGQPQAQQGVSGQQPGLGRQAPTPLHIPPPSGSVPSLSTPSSATPTGGDHVKVKVFYDGELIAIRVPAALPFSDLYNRIGLRLGHEQPQLYLNNDFVGPIIDNEPAFRKAITQGKIVLYAK